MSGQKGFGCLKYMVTTYIYQGLINRGFRANFTLEYSKIIYYTPS